jgi:hypothetical protein
MGWRSTDLEAIRLALGIAVSHASVRAINDEMLALAAFYPDAIGAAQDAVDAIAAIDAQILAATTPATAPVLRQTRKAAVTPTVPGDPLPVRKMDVLEYATDLLTEEVTTEYDRAPQPLVLLASQRELHVQLLLDVLPKLELWTPQQHDRFCGQLLPG